MYLPDAKIIWNGNTVSPNPISISPFLDTLPLSRHDLQSLDCHPMPGMFQPLRFARMKRADGIAPAAAGPAPDILLTVTGSVLHGPSITHSSSNNAREPLPRDKPRKFHELFVLRAAEQGEGMQPKVCIVLSSMD